MNRHEAVDAILRSLKGDELLLAANTVNMDLYSLKDSDHNFYVSPMGLTSSVGLGVALSRPRRKVIVLDTDGNILMNLSSLATVAFLSPPNFIHFVLDNEAMDSTGGQVSASSVTELDRVAQAAGYRQVRRVDSEAGLIAATQECLKLSGPSFVLVKIERGISAVPMVALSPQVTKERFRKAAIGSV